MVEEDRTCSDQVRAVLDGWFSPGQVEHIMEVLELYDNGEVGLNEEVLPGVSLLELLVQVGLMEKE